MDIKELIDKAVVPKDVTYSTGMGTRTIKMPDLPIIDLMNGFYRVYHNISKKLNKARGFLYVMRHCGSCSSPLFFEKENDQYSGNLSKKRHKTKKEISVYCNDNCAKEDNSIVVKETKSWEGYEDVLKIKESIKDNTTEVTIRGELYRVKDAPNVYVNHFKKYNPGNILKRWIDKQFYHKRRYFLDPEGECKRRKDFYWKDPELARKKQRDYTKNVYHPGEYYQNKLAKARVETKKRQDKISDYKNSPEGIAEKRLKEKNSKEKRRKEDMERYYDNPIKYSLKRLLLHAINNSIEGKPYEKSNKVIDYKRCIKKLENEAKDYGYTIKEIKDLKFQIDHIIPISAYDCNSEEELIKSFNSSNLRWLSGSENSSKNNRIRPKDLEVILELPVEIYPKGGFLKIKALTKLVKELYK